MSTDFDNVKSLTSPIHLPGWTKEDKGNFLEALKEFGSSNVANIASFVEKPEQEVRKAIDVYKKRAQICHEPASKPAREPQIKSIPLDSWTNFMMNNLKSENFQSETANAIRILSDFECIPKAMFTQSFNFKEIYSLIADAMEGKPLKGHNDSNKYALHRCIVETALYCNKFSKRINSKQVLSEAVNSEPGQNFFFINTNDLELSIIRKLGNMPNYNSLNIPVEALNATAKHYLPLA